MVCLLHHLLLAVCWHTRLAWLLLLWWAWRTCLQVCCLCSLVPRLQQLLLLLLAQPVTVGALGLG
jgi:hypothetical protein